MRCSLCLGAGTIFIASGEMLDSITCPWCEWERYCTGNQPAPLMAILQMEAERKARELGVEADQNSFSFVLWRRYLEEEADIGTKKK